MTTTNYWDVATQVCTPKELETLKLRDRGLSLRSISLATGISIATVRSRLFNADRKINLELRKEPAA